jgi:hypothetical protein
MARPVRFIPKRGLVEVTTRTFQGRFLLRPSPELNDLVLGVIGRAQSLFEMIIHAFVVMSNHTHFILSPSDAKQLADFMRFVNSNLAREVARLHNWPERVWSRRYRAIPILDERAAHARLRYVLAHGAKENLVANSGRWPGANCVAALSHGDGIRGTWIDRSAEYRARAQGKRVLPGQHATVYDVKLTPMPCLAHLSPDQRQAECRRVVAEIQKKVEDENRPTGKKPLGVEAILAQNPHHRPDLPDRSPAPFVHVHDKELGDAFRDSYRAFVIDHRNGVASLKDRAFEFTALFPESSFPPALPFVAPAPA